MNKPQSHKSTGSAGPRLPDFSALAAAISSPATSEPNFDAIAKLGDTAAVSEADVASEAEPDSPVDVAAPAEANDQSVSESPIAIDLGIKPAAKASLPAAPTIQVAAAKPTAVKPAVSKSPQAQSVVNSATASKAPAPKSKPSLDFLSQAAAPESPASAPFEITTTKPEAPAVKVQVAPSKPVGDKRSVEKPVEKPDAEKPLKRSSSAAASLPGFAEFAAIANSVSETAPAVEVKAEASKPVSAAVASPIAGLSESLKAASVTEVSVSTSPAVRATPVVAVGPAISTSAPVVSSPAVAVTLAPKTAAEPAAKKRSASTSSAKNPWTYVADITAGLVFATAGYQLYQAFTSNSLGAGIPAAIGTIALGVGLLGISQALRLLTRIANDLNA